MTVAAELAQLLPPWISKHTPLAAESAVLDMLLGTAPQRE